ncbi:MAG: hypothetical protein JWM02_2810, partial [Frankiales bacterium]|nr:hypothetical protein [Frankiales bacterium]
MTAVLSNTETVNAFMKAAGERDYETALAL